MKEVNDRSKLTKKERERETENNEMATNLLTCVKV